MRSARHGRLGVEPRVPNHRHHLDAGARLLRRQHLGVRASRASIRGFVRARNATGGFPRVATVESCRAIVRADPLFSSFPRIRYMEAQKLYPKKPAKKMGAKKRAREMLKKGVQQAGE